MDVKTQGPAVVELTDAKVHFGAVKALDGVTIRIAAGECVGLVGHNGAGKSTIVNIINGGLTPHSGSVSCGGETVERYGIAAARSHGVRCVFQELSLCPNLTVIENTRVMHRGLTGWGWRGRAAAIIGQSLDAIFPGHGIEPEATIGDLSIAERQMVEIATAFSTISNPVKLVILDEPTSSLDASLAAQLLAYVRVFVRNGGSIILISHILGEILSATDRIIVMKDGKVVAEKPSAEFDHHSLVAVMGSVVKARDAEPARARADQSRPLLSAPPRKGKGLPFSAFPGELVGLAGLGGHGQTDILLELYLSRTGNWMRRRNAEVTFVAGDRALNGVFPLWSILKNLTIANLNDLSPGGMLRDAKEEALGMSWKEKIEIRTKDMENRILSLSGGNQQKVLFARALATTAPVVLMDDPMRGVDVGTKQEVYAIIRAEAAKGRTFVWYSTEMEEVGLCDRVFVFSEGVIVRELVGTEVTEENILSASFTGVAA
ncbi:sugar ABC transporter ATP-binding protein [Rhizobium tumorigenes]|uniref:sugar ABC transporter ATP-binding protein n=1 Tax=Rhizobium tumorigenes TaxID=2041385 RepID=UPI00241FD139|nr:sugar ABC transporter ATP-binding protein [Rhizobium tumorigenes]WFS04132.1 sugar ABC transporter ATP-binding protein [Rhizobium tumorigenes]